jgi:hypothetical protein
MSDETPLLQENGIPPNVITSLGSNDPVDAEFTEIILESRSETQDEIKKRIRAEKIAGMQTSATEELNNLLTEASTIQRNITNAKTKIKKVYFTKKMEKVKYHMRQVIGIVQQLERLTTPSEGSDHDVIDSTVATE